MDDFLFDETHALRYLVVDTSQFWRHKWMLIACTAVQNIDAPSRAIYVSLTRDQIAQSPSVDTADIELIETLPSLVMS